MVNETYFVVLEFYNNRTHYSGHHVESGVNPAIVRSLAAAWVKKSRHCEILDEWQAWVADDELHTLFDHLK